MLRPTILKNLAYGHFGTTELWCGGVGGDVRGQLHFKFEIKRYDPKRDFGPKTPKW